MIKIEDDLKNYNLLVVQVIGIKFGWNRNFPRFLIFTKELKWQDEVCTLQAALLGRTNFSLQLGIERWLSKNKFQVLAQ
jgi:hypothetical protein